MQHNPGIMFAARPSAASDGSPREDTCTTAQTLFWLLPRFSRWAMARVAQQPTPYEISLQQLTVLHLVQTEGLTLAELARRSMVAPTVITGIVDRLERQSLIRRDPDPRDRRINRLTVTERGLELSDELERELMSEIAAELSNLSREEQIALRNGLSLIEGLVGRLVVARGL